MKIVKLIDVAEEAGVSKSTVSQFLSGRFNYMSTDTKVRIQEAVDRLEYVPNNIARSLRTNRTRTIGVVVRDITAVYTSQAVRAIDDYCRVIGYSMLICNTDFHASVEARAVKMLGQLGVDGIIISSSGANADLLAEFSDLGTPVVQFMLESDNGAKSMVSSDFKQGAFEATEHLLQLGHKRICFVTMDFVSVKSGHERYLGYVEALNKYHIPVNDQLIQYWHRETGFQNSPQNILKFENAPTAFFSQHQEITISLLQELNEAAINIPEEVSLIGFDDIPLVEFFKVPVTTVKQRPYEIGAAAAKLLINQAQKPVRENERIRIPCSLVKRDSCKKPNSAI